MRALVTGIGGFVGAHLARLLLDDPNFTVVGTVIESFDQHRPLSEAGVQLRRVDLTDEAAVYQLLRETQPEQLYHLAAQTFVPESFENPWGTLSNNIKSQLNLLHAMVRLDLDARILVVGSGEEYGPVRPEQNPIDENQALRPANPYSVSKVAQDMLALQYFLSHDVATIRVRPFNQIGPGQGKQFVAPAFASQIATIEKGEAEPLLHVGNLEARRDFTDVRDMVRAYRLLLSSGDPGEVYNIGTGQAHSIQEMLDILLNLSDAPIEVRVDPARFRPVDAPITVCNPAKVRAATGWTPGYTFEQTLSDVLADWRTRLGVAIP